MENPYERIVLLDGTRVFRKPEDLRNEAQIAAVVAAAWECEICRFPSLSPVDWYAARFDRVIGVLELKARTHALRTYPTVFLAVRKWLALQMASLGLEVPGIFVVKFTDRVSWVPIAQIDASRMRVAGRRDRANAPNDIEPVIEVDIEILRDMKHANTKPAGEPLRAAN